MPPPTVIAQGGGVRHANSRALRHAATRARLSDRAARCDVFGRSIVKRNDDPERGFDQSSAVKSAANTIPANPTHPTAKGMIRAVRSIISVGIVVFLLT